MSDLYSLPADLPVPTDDGAADHLIGRALPSIGLPATSGVEFDPSRHDSEWLALFVYPMTGRPGLELPAGRNEIPGARGCTPQACAFRDRQEVLTELGVTIAGLSVQGSSYQREMSVRLSLSYPVLSDELKCFGDALALPTFVVKMPSGEDAILYRRLTMIARHGVIEHVMYPVFPSDENAAAVESWIRSRPAPVG